MKKEPKKLPGFLDGLPGRSYMIMIIAGVYLAYLGYQLCHGILTGESSGIGFLIGGVIFVIVGIGMAIVGIYGSSLSAKQTSEEETKVEDAEEALSEAEDAED